VPPKVDLEQMFFAVADDESDRENVLRRARGMTARVRKGADLAAEATLAGVELQDLGAIPEADLRPDLKTALDGLGDSGLTEPIQVNGGFQVVNLLRRIPAGYQPFDEVKEQLRRRLSQASYQDQTQGLVAKLTKEYLVEIHREYLDMVLERLPDV
jgi:parvulin-like peptidyl-prolyl isomerase